RDASKIEFSNRCSSIGAKAYAYVGLPQAGLDGNDAIGTRGGYLGPRSARFRVPSPRSPVMALTQSESKPAVALVNVTRVVVRSTNPVKVAAAQAVMDRSGSVARVEGLAVPSGVRDQPEGD